MNWYFYFLFTFLSGVPFLGHAETSHSWIFTAELIKLEGNQATIRIGEREVQVLRSALRTKSHLFSGAKVEVFLTSGELLKTLRSR